jgi:hypothetical protein
VRGILVTTAKVLVVRVLAFNFVTAAHGLSVSVVHDVSVAGSCAQTTDAHDYHKCDGAIGVAARDEA